MTFPATTLLPVFILGVLAIDLTFDLGGLPPAATISYYTGHRTAAFPANMFVISAIVVGAVPLVKQLAKPQLVDYAALGILVAALVDFVGFLIPFQVRACVCVRVARSVPFESALGLCCCIPRVARQSIEGAGLHASPSLSSLL